MMKLRWKPLNGLFYSCQPVLLFLVVCALVLQASSLQAKATVSVSNEAQLQAALSQTGDLNISLTGNIALSSPITFGGSAYVITGNGYTITTNGNAFTLPTTLQARTS